MSSLRKHSKLLVVATSCVAIGAGASVIASAGAATSAGAGQSANSKHGARKAGLSPPRLLARAVHADLVVPGKNGFVTMTIDRGAVQSVNGQALTLTEGTRKMTYKTLTLTIPANARIRVNHKPAALSALKAGQRVLVIGGPKRTLVSARDAAGA